MARWNGSTSGRVIRALRPNSVTGAISFITLRPGQTQLVTLSGNLGIVPDNRQTVKPVLSADWARGDSCSGGPQSWSGARWLRPWPGQQGQAFAARSACAQALISSSRAV